MRGEFCYCRHFDYLMFSNKLHHHIKQKPYIFPVTTSMSCFLDTTSKGFALCTEKNSSVVCTFTSAATNTQKSAKKRSGTNKYVTGRISTAPDMHIWLTEMTSISIFLFEHLLSPERMRGPLVPLKTLAFTKKGSYCTLNYNTQISK